MSRKSYKSIKKVEGMAGRLTVMLPAYNEEVSLKAFLPNVVKHYREKGYSIIVVNLIGETG